MTVTYKLKDLLTIKNGRDHQHLSNGNIPIYGSGGMMRLGNKALYDKDSILLPRKGSLKNIQYVNHPFWTVDTIYYTVVNNSKVNTYYLYRYLKLLDLSGLDSGTGVPSMTFDSYYNITISLPDILTQQKIASVLSSLDNKIELNNRIIGELEQMAKQLYDYWFVQFDFPNAEGKPYRSSGGKMVYDEKLKREIPEGWEVKKLSDWIKKEKGGDWGKEEQSGNYNLEVSCIRGADINGLNGQGECKAPVRYILMKNKEKVLSPGDFIIEISGGSPTQSTGRIAPVIQETLDRFSTPIICSNFCKAITLKDPSLCYNFFFLWKQVYDYGILFGFEGKTSGIKNFLYESFVTSYWVTEPPTALRNTFTQLIDPIERNKQKVLKENQQLSTLRDWLLPMLMNGQVTVE